MAARATRDNKGRRAPVADKPRTKKPTSPKTRVAATGAAAKRALQVIGREVRAVRPPRSGPKVTAPRSVELFSGCGGLALGTARAGFSHQLLVEWNEDAYATLEHNKARGVNHVGDWPLVHGDVRKMEWAGLADAVDLVAGGPPCQPFSIGGKHRGDADERDMWPEAIRAVRDLRPRAFLFENVRGLTRAAFADYLKWIQAHLASPAMIRRKGEDFERHLKRLLSSQEGAEYEVLIQQFNAADFGAPQKRHRVVIAGIRCDVGSPLPLLRATHSRERLLWDQWVTSEYWDRHGLKRPASGPANERDARTVSKLRSAQLAPSEAPWMTVRDALIGLGEPDGLNNHTFQAGARAYPGHTGSPLDEPAKALKAGVHGVPGGENMMVRDDGSVRYFTVREAARLQGLPDEWQFVSSWSESMRQLGNAVPTQLAEALGSWIGEGLKAGRSRTKKVA